MTNAVIRVKGPLFDGRRELLTPAIKSTLKYGKTTLQTNTPVVTGNLRKNWHYSTEQKSVWNDTPYAYYVENGTRHFTGRGMIARSVTDIEEFFIKAIEEQVKKLGG